MVQNVLKFSYLFGNDSLTQIFLLPLISLLRHVFLQFCLLESVFLDSCTDTRYIPHTPPGFILMNKSFFQDIECYFGCNTTFHCDAHRFPLETKKSLSSLILTFNQGTYLSSNQCAMIPVSFGIPLSWNRNPIMWLILPIVSLFVLRGLMFS